MQCWELPGGWGLLAQGAPTLFSTYFASWETAVPSIPRQSLPVKAGLAPERVVAKFLCYSTQNWKQNNSPQFSPVNTFKLHSASKIPLPQWCLHSLQTHPQDFLLPSSSSSPLSFLVYIFGLQSESVVRYKYLTTSSIRRRRGAWVCSICHFP